MATMTCSCIETDSTLVEFVDDNQLNSPNDTVYSLVGIINKMQQVADRTILLGELRGDLTSLTTDAHLDLQDIANFTPSAENPYCQARDYYAVIQNCNYYLAHADSLLTKRGEKVFLKEIGVVRTYRAWAYLQLALNYGRVPFFTQPLLTELEADPKLHPLYDLKQIADYFIADLAPYVDTPQPAYGSMNQLDSRRFFIPVRVMLGDLCLWSGRYQEAADYYHAFLTKQGETRPTQLNNVAWGDIDFSVDMVADDYASAFSSTTGSELLTIIPMNEKKYDGIVSTLPDVFGSTEENSYFYQATRSQAYDELSQSQHYTMVYRNPVTNRPDTIGLPDDYVYPADNMRGDLRQQSIYKLRTVAGNSSNYSDLRQTHYKHNSGRFVTLYRLQTVYLRYAEALNRLGLPQTAFAVLKYGLCDDNLKVNIGGVNVDRIPQWEREKGGDLISFSQYTFTRSNTQGIHSRGCGNADADKNYDIPACANLTDSILCVENLIADEMALETAAEGLRWYDLMRISKHRGSTEFLANKVAGRGGKNNFNSTVYNHLLDEKNWYLPLQ